MNCCRFESQRMKEEEQRDRKSNFRTVIKVFLLLLTVSWLLLSGEEINNHQTLSRSSTVETVSINSAAASPFHSFTTSNSTEKQLTQYTIQHSNV